jgi:hypothetical protein
MGNCRCNSEKWEAWHNREPGGAATLHVRGMCECPTAGYELALRRHEPQGVNPEDLLLDLVEREPSGGAAQVVTSVEVEYEEKSDARFATVSVLPDGPLAITVQEVS